MSELGFPHWLNSLKPYVPGKPVEELERELGIPAAIKLASNENPRGSSPMAREAAAEALGRLNIYPDAGTWRLRHALADKLELAADRFLVGNGSNELLTLFARSFATPADHAVITEHAFVAHRIVLHAAGIPTTVAPARGYAVDVDALVEACTPQTRLLFLANPNNPTGQWIGRAQLDDLLRRVPERVLVVIDEAYFEYVRKPGYASALELLDVRANLAVTRTFSKVYGLAALRTGYAYVPDHVASVVNRIREPFNVNGVAQAAATAALSDDDWVRESVELNDRELARLATELRSLGLEPVEGAGNFLFVRTTSFGGRRWDGPSLYDRLLRAGVIVRPLQPYGIDDHVRITVGLPDENDRLLAALRSLA